jgi:hypothetical protein
VLAADIAVKRPFPSHLTTPQSVIQSIQTSVAVCSALSGLYFSNGGQNMHTDTIADRVIAVDYGMSLPDMIAAGRYHKVDARFTAVKFPVQGTGKIQFRSKLFEFGRRISSEEAGDGIKKIVPCRPPTSHGLAFGAAFPELQGKHLIACLGSSHG